MYPLPEQSIRYYVAKEYAQYSTAVKYAKVEGDEPIDKLLSKGGNDKDNESLKKLKRATIFVFCFFIVEVIGGIWAGSLAVITDAAHLLTDISVSSSTCMLLLL